MKQFFLGLLTMASAVAALFLARYWKVSGDRLFAFFALAFTAMTANWIGCRPWIQHSRHSIMSIWCDCSHSR
jgi:Family of unknown function (DUF5985)